MAGKTKKRSSAKTIRFQLSLGGVVGVAIVCCCLFLWMFLLGVWAGQTILLPSARPEIDITRSKKDIKQTDVKVTATKTKVGKSEGDK